MKIFLPHMLAEDTQDAVEKLLGNNEKSTDVNFTGQSTLELICLVLLIVIIIACSYFFSRWLGARQQKRVGHSYFQTIDTYRLNRNAYLQIVSAGSKYYLLGIGKDTVSVIGELSEADISTFQDRSMQPKSFKELFGGMIRKKSTDPEEGLSEEKKTEEKVDTHEDIQG